MLASSAGRLGRVQRPSTHKSNSICSDGRMGAFRQQCSLLKLGHLRRHGFTQSQLIARASSEGDSAAGPTPHGQQQQQQSVAITQEIASTASRPEDDEVNAAIADQLEQQEASLAVEQAVEEDAFDAAALAARQQTSAAPPAPSVAVPEEVQQMSTAQLAKEFVMTNPALKFMMYGAGAFFGITFVIAVARVALKNLSPQAKRKKTVNKNKVVIDALSQYLPANRVALNSSVMTGIRLRTGFTPVEIFRKYLWYLLRERKFDNDAVADVLALRTALGLSEDQVAEALKERAQRIYDKYGNVMLEMEGMTQAGIERKATARALFSKMLYLVENEELLSSTAAETVNLRDIFGATDDDVARLRIASLYEVDLDAAMGLPDAPESGAEGASDAQ